METWIIFSLLFLFFHQITAKYAVGTVDTTNSGENWVFLTRFCFVTKIGRLQYHFEYPVDYGTESILLYYDEPGQWEYVYKTDTNCSTKYNVLNPRNNQIIGLSDDKNDITAEFSNCHIIDKAGYKFWNCTGERTFRSSRERWWFIALSRCGESTSKKTGLKLDYKMHMTNGEPDEALIYEFSADEFYILHVDIGFLMAYLIMVALSIVCAVKLKERQLFHTTYKMYIVSLTFWALHLFILCVAYGRYSNSGYPKPNSILLARLCSATSLLVFLLMLILMAKGYTITRGKLSQQGAIKITIFTCLYVVIYAVLFIWEAELFDPGKVLYLYDSPPGYGLVAMRLIGWVWFLYAIFFTLKNYPSKGSFYYPLFIFYTVWFWAGPIIILIAQHALALWTREKTVNGVEQLVALLGHLFFLILTRPGAANKNFPYHVRTSQIGAMINGPEQNSTQRNESGQTIDYQHSITTYNSANGTGPDLSGLFVVSHTHSEEKPQVTQMNFINGSDDLPVFQGRLPPLNAAPSAPPRYESLFTVGGQSSSTN